MGKNKCKKMFTTFTLSNDLLLQLETSMNEGMENGKIPPGIKRRFGYNTRKGHTCHFLQSHLEQLGLLEKIREVMLERGNELVENNNLLYPNVAEYIFYESKNNINDDLGWHTDDPAVELTLVIMFSPKDSYTGGNFKHRDKQRNVEEVPLKRGECCLFRGNTLEHAVSEITKGTRKVLVIEFSTEKEVFGTEHSIKRYESLNE